MKLSPDIMQQVKEAREAAKAAKKRNVSAAATSPDKDEGDERPEDESQDAIASNGTSFGSGAYQQGAKKVKWAKKSS